MRARVRICLLLCIGALYVISVPWYRDSDAPVAYLLGLPDWVAVAVACYAAVAVLNAGAWLLADLPEDAAGGGAGRAGEPPGRGGERDA